jgi:hypothetical protein
MGQERVTTLVTEGDKKQFFANHFYSRTTCRFYDRATYDNTLRDGMYVVPLKEHGKLLRVEIRSRGEVGRSFFYDPRDSEGRRLPFDFHDFAVSHIKFYAFKQRYLIKPWFGERGRHDEWARNDCAPAWWLAADGATEAFCVPTGPWYAPASILLEPLRDGMAVVSHRVFDDRPSPGGLYFVDGAGHVKLVDGWVHSPATSPSGCRLAFTHAPDHWAAAYGRGRGKTALKMIDFCIENR